MTCEDCNCIHEGDIAEHIMNPKVFGVVVGFMGSLVALRVVNTLKLRWFQGFELRRKDTEDTDPGAREDLPEDNVINFTKAKALRANTKTKGSA